MVDPAQNSSGISGHRHTLSPAEPVPRRQDLSETLKFVTLNLVRRPSMLSKHGPKTGARSRRRSPPDVSCGSKAEQLKVSITSPLYGQ